MFVELVGHYYNLAVIHGYTGFTAKVSLLCALIVLHQGGVRNAGRLFAGLLVAHFVVAALFALGGGLLGVAQALVCVAVIAALVIRIYEGEWRWTVLPRDDNARMAAIAALALVFVFPFWHPQGIISGTIFSLMAVAPHQTLMALLVLMAVEGRDAPRPMIAVALMAGVVIGAIDLLVGYRATGAIVLVYTAGAAAAVFALPVWMNASGGRDSEDDNAPAVRPVATRPAARPAASAKPAPAADPPSSSRRGGKKWNIK